MSRNLRNVAFTFVTLSIGNVLWHAFTDHAWMEAAKISYFQGVALVIYTFTFGQEPR